MKKRIKLHLEGFETKFDETIFFMQSINRSNKNYFFLWSVTIFIGSLFFLYVGFISDSKFFQIFFFTTCIMLFLFAIRFVIMSYSEKKPRSNTIDEYERDGDLNVFDIEFLEKLFAILEKNKIYDKANGQFGLPGYRFKSKTQLAVLLNLIMFDSHSKKFSNVNQKDFLKSFKEHFKKHYCLEDKNFKEEIDFSDSYFSANIKKNLFVFDKMNISKIAGLNSQSEYFELYNEFRKTLIFENI